ncbi:hypothetical protein [Arthrobacter sp. Alg241-R88]|jgi:hypothetical protein|uniref:hypothetical protein n=1 Tax=Arthrobacter sp. Alg241-R88 TaxID=2305984 RepID=UPI0013D6B7D9|nr:hypothetical protein [Arthrobacter sp. Alg241-R88]
MIDLSVIIGTAALVVTLALLVTLVGLEVRRVGPEAGQPTTRPTLLGRTVSRRVVAVMWIVSLLFFLPRVLELLA